MTKKEAKVSKINKTVKNNKSVDKYDPSKIEPYWQAKWDSAGVYQSDLESANKPFYNLMMFPYPSAEGLHMGSVFTFSGVDIYGRFKRMQGYDVFEPIGLDGFGIHSENHAIKTGTHPIEHARRTEENFYRQLQTIGNGFDWKHKVETYDPHYYKWTQWLFIELYKAGLAYRKKSPVNFCPSCKTVLADEQVIDGKCERCGSVVEKRDLEQWFFRITNYAERLLKNIEKLNWTEKVKIAQRNWIGRSEGVRIKFALNVSGQKDGKHFIEVFTTRPDTLFGATFLVISPELAKYWLSVGWKAPTGVVDYIEKAMGSDPRLREAADREKTGVYTKVIAINPVTNKEIPVWVADYVLGGYGTGAIMAVPAHDQRDFEFAQNYKLAISTVILNKSEGSKDSSDLPQNDKEGAYTGSGVLVNSGEWNGLEVPKEINKVLNWLENKGIGKREVNYHLRDWLISRQRYWGPPIPMIYCEACAEKGRSWLSLKPKTSPQPSPPLSSRRAPSSAPKRRGRTVSENNDWDSAGWFPVEEKDLPVKLPYVEDFKPMGTGKSPLANYPEFYETLCPDCGGKARRETDVSDTFLDSAWYFLRYLATDWKDMPFPSVKFARSKKQESRSKNEIENWKFKIENSARRAAWLPVNMYIGGAEHSVLHLLYARFIWKVLLDLGHIGFSAQGGPRSAGEEPFARFYAHGLLIKDGAKMSKSRGNVINPDDYIRKFGADALRTYLHFLGPFNEDGDFRDTGIEGMHRFLKRVWRLFAENTQNNTQKNPKDRLVSRNVPLSSASLRMMHRTIAGVTEELKNLRYNTAIAKLMSWYNFLAKQESVSRSEAENYLKLLAPFAPHLAEGLWHALNYAETGPELRGKEWSIHTSKWPKYDPKYVKEDVVKIPVQVNGKLREMIEVDSVTVKEQSEIEKMAMTSEKVQGYLNGKQILKVIYVPGKVINFVLGS